MYSGRGTCVQFGVADRQEGPAVSVHCEELYCMYCGRGTCVHFGVGDRQEGPTVSVSLWGDLFSVRFSEYYFGYQLKENEMGRACGT